jgi:Mrp family chromosome partitioning ATPase/capsular polysaccharide biosynthesis protein
VPAANGDPDEDAAPGGDHALSSTRHRGLSESEPPLTFSDFLSILWRRKLIVVVSIVVAVAAAFGYSKVHTPKYQSTATIQISSTTNSSGQSTSPVTLPDPIQTLNSTSVEQKAAHLVGDGDVAAVASQVSGTVDPTTGSLTITATSTKPENAQAVAKAYSQAFLADIQSVVNSQSQKITNAITGLQSQIAYLELHTAVGTTNPQVGSLEQTVSSLQTEQENISLGEPYASIEVAPQLPTSPTGLGKTTLLAIGFLAGLLVGCGIALVWEEFDTRVRATPDIASVTEAPILAELPEDNEVRSGKVSIAMLQAPQSLMAESIRELRTSLRVILEDTPLPVLVVTSPDMGDGKSFVTANLAAAWAMRGSKVIVASADFRRPRIEEIFGIEVAGQPGLSDLIRSAWKNRDAEHPDNSGQADADEADQPDPSDRSASIRRGTSASARSGRRGATSERLRTARSRTDQPSAPAELSLSSMLIETPVPDLLVLPAGTQIENPSELFGSPGMQPVLDQLQTLADVVLLDTPPVLAAPDTAVLGRLTRGAIIVAAEGKTDRNDLERTIRRLEITHCRVLGIALNRVKHLTTDSYQSYAYRQ